MLFQKSADTGYNGKHRIFMILTVIKKMNQTKTFFYRLGITLFILLTFFFLSSDFLYCDEEILVASSNSTTGSLLFLNGFITYAFPPLGVTIFVLVFSRNLIDAQLKSPVSLRTPDISEDSIIVINEQLNNSNNAYFSTPIVAGGLFLLVVALFFLWGYIKKNFPDSPDSPGSDSLDFSGSNMLTTVRHSPEILVARNQGFIVRNQLSTSVNGIIIPHTFPTGPIESMPFPREIMAEYCSSDQLDELEQLWPGIRTLSIYIVSVLRRFF
jgi:hypothetical protein